MNTITIKEAKEMYYKNLITKEKFDEIFDETLDEEFGPILEYNTSRVLKEIDPIAYRTLKNDYANNLIQDGHVIEEFFDFEDYLITLEERGWRIEDEDQTQITNLSM